jgi:hypothetical protein
MPMMTPRISGWGCYEQAQQEKDLQEKKGHLFSSETLGRQGYHSGRK